MCTNYIGGYNCSCREGYSLVNGTRCKDINECLFNATNQCQHMCTNYIGGYNCSCREGYSLVNGTRCKDINECLFNATNQCQHMCTNYIGGYNCSCREGYSLVNGTSCEDVNECSSNATNTCQQICHNFVGSYNCSCYQGYTLVNSTNCEEQTSVGQHSWSPSIQGDKSSASTSPLMLYSTQDSSLYVSFYANLSDEVTTMSSSFFESHSSIVSAPASPYSDIFSLQTVDGSVETISIENSKTFSASFGEVQTASFSADLVEPSSLPTRIQSDISRLQPLKSSTELQETLSSAAMSRLSLSIESSITQTSLQKTSSFATVLTTLNTLSPLKSAPDALSSAAVSLDIETSFGEVQSTSFSAISLVEPSSSPTSIQSDISRLQPLKSSTEIQETLSSAAISRLSSAIESSITQTSLQKTSSIATVLTTQNNLSPLKSTPDALSSAAASLDKETSFGKVQITSFSAISLVEPSSLPTRIQSDISRFQPLKSSTEIQETLSSAAISRLSSAIESSITQTSLQKTSSIATVLTTQSNLSPLKSTPGALSSAAASLDKETPFGEVQVTSFSAISLVEPSSLPTRIQSDISRLQPLKSSTEIQETLSSAAISRLSSAIESSITQTSLQKTSSFARVLTTLNTLSPLKSTPDALSSAAASLDKETSFGEVQITSFSAISLVEPSSLPTSIQSDISRLQPLKSSTEIQETLSSAVVSRFSSQVKSSITQSPSFATDLTTLRSLSPSKSTIDAIVSAVTSSEIVSKPKQVTSMVGSTIYDTLSITAVSGTVSAFTSVMSPFLTVIPSVVDPTSSDKKVTASTTSLLKEENFSVTGSATRTSSIPAFITIRPTTIIFSSFSYFTRPSKQYIASLTSASTALRSREVDDSSVPKTVKTDALQTTAQFPASQSFSFDNKTTQTAPMSASISSTPVVSVSLSFSKQIPANITSSSAFSSKTNRTSSPDITETTSLVAAISSSSSSVFQPGMTSKLHFRINHFQ